MHQIIKLECVLPEDCEIIRDHMVEVFEDEKARWFHNGEAPFIPGYDSVEMQKYYTWDNKYFKIIYQEQMVGVVLVTYTGREHARIDRLYIWPQYQNLHLGSVVLKVLEESFPQVAEWSLDTIQASPRNHHFYEKNGYVVVDEDEDERCYRKRIPSVTIPTTGYSVGLDLSNENYRDCNMAATDYYETNLMDARFSNSNLSHVIIMNCCLEGNRFTNDNLNKSIFADSRMNEVEICHVYMEGSQIHDADLTDVSIKNCNMQGMTIDGIGVEDLLQCYRERENLNK